MIYLKEHSLSRKEWGRLKSIIRYLGANINVIENGAEGRVELIAPIEKDFLEVTVPADKAALVEEQCVKFGFTVYRGTPPPYKPADVGLTF